MPTGKVRYDNLKAAVAKVIGFARERQENERWILFREHFGVESFYCRPGIAGAHEKGGVEGDVGYFRRNRLVPVPEVHSLHERLIAKGREQLVLDHYLEALVRKPGALPGATALEQAKAAGKFTPVHDAWWAAACKAHGDRDGTRALIELTFNGTIIETGTDSYRLAQSRARAATN